METAAMKKDGHRHIPEVLIEKILLYLPVKSLFRFSVVSKSWHSMIFAPEFAKSYRGQEMIVLRAYSNSGDKAVACPLFSLSSDNPMDRAKPFIRPFQASSYLDASCGQLWCLEFEDSLLLYNPSTHSYRKLPVPSAPVPIGSAVRGTAGSVYVYGLGYDSVSDDYKIVKIHRSNYVETELYSLKSDSWKEVEGGLDMTFLSSKGVFFSGAVHWLVYHYELDDPTADPGNAANYVCRQFILSFDLTTDRFGELNLPKPPSEQQGINITAFGGKLCFYMHNQRHSRFDAWVLEDYGSRSWTREFQIDYGNNHPLCHAYLKPFCFYDCSGNLVKAVTCSADMRNFFVYKDGSSALEERSFGRYGCGMFDTYVDSFVSPFPSGHDMVMKEALLDHGKEREEESVLEHGHDKALAIIENGDNPKGNHGHDIDIGKKEVWSNDEVYNWESSNEENNGHGRHGQERVVVLEKGECSKKRSNGHGKSLALKKGESFMRNHVYRQLESFSSREMR